MNEETGMLGGTTEEDFVNPTDEKDTSVNVFDTQEEKSEETVAKFERPEGLPSEFWDEENGMFKGNELFDEYKKEKERVLNLRQKISKGLPKAPDSIEGYQINHEKLSENIGYDIDEDDAGIAIFKKVAFENGLAPETFNDVLTGYMKEVMNHPDFNKETEGPSFSAEDQAAYQKEELQKLGDNAEGIIRGIKNWNQQLFYDGVFSEEDLKVAQNMGFSADEIRVLNKYRESAGNLSFPDGGNHIDGMESQQEIDKILASPEYEKDPVLQKRVSDYFHRKYS